MVDSLNSLKVRFCIKLKENHIFAVNYLFYGPKLKSIISKLNSTFRLLGENKNDVKLNRPLIE